MDHKGHEGEMPVGKNTLVLKFQKIVYAIREYLAFLALMIINLIEERIIYLFFLIIMNLLLCKNYF